MTAPIVPANGGEGDSAKLLDMDDAAFAASLGLEKTHPTAPEPQPRGEDGKFVAKEKPTEEAVAEEKDATVSTETPEAEAAPAEEAVAEEAKEEAEAEKPEEPAEPVKPPLTKFQAVDAEGKPVELPNAILKYKVDGKIVENDLTKTVHLAQQATYNARQVQELTQANQSGGEQLQQALNTIQQYEQSLAQMFTNEALYVRARELHLAANSPEQVAQAAQARLAALEQQNQQQQEFGAVAQFVAGTIEPALVELVKEYPSVTMDDLAGRIALASKAYEVNGRVPLANMAKVAHFVNTELSDWAESVHSKRSEASQVARTSLDKARAATQAKQRQMGKALAPVGAATANAPKTAPIIRAADIFNDPLFGGQQ